MIRHDRELSFEYGVVQQVSPLIRRVVCRNPGVFTLMGTGTYLVGRGSVAVIDPGPGLAEHIDAINAALGAEEQISHVLVTHTHSDHSTAAPALASAHDALTYGFGPHGDVAEHDLADRVDFSSYFEPDELNTLIAAYEDLDPALKFEGPDLEFVPEVVLSDGDVIEGDGWSMEAVWTPGHCSNHLCYSLREESALFSGDHVMAWATTVVGPPDGSMAQYLASLRKLSARGERIYYPTHGPAVEDPAKYVLALLAHREEREAQILSLLSDRPTGIEDIVPVLYASYDKQLWYPAAASVHAHLLGLVEDGKVTVDDDGPPKLSAQYRLS